MATRSEVFAEIVNKASALIEKLGFTLTKEQAIAQVMDRDPALYARYREARPDPVPPAPGPTVRQLANQGFLAHAQQVAQRDGISQVDAILKVAATPDGQTLKKVTHDPVYATLTLAQLAKHQDRQARA